MKKPILAALRVLDATRLTDQQRGRLAQLYDKVKSLDLGRIPEIATDAVRAQIDAGLVDILGIDANLLDVRELVANEPLLLPTPAVEAPAKPTAKPGVERVWIDEMPVPTASRRPPARAAGRRAGAAALKKRPARGASSAR
jgi:hypothetical protein